MATREKEEKKKGLLLIIEDDEGIRKQLKWALCKEYEILFAFDKPSALEKLKNKPPVITLDLGLPPKPNGTEIGFELLKEILKSNPFVKVIIITGQDEKENALKAIDMGAYDFYCKPIDLNEMEIILKRAFRIYDLEIENQELRKAPMSTKYLDQLIGSCPKMKEVFSMVRKVATSDFSVLIQGESGTGKEVIARAIHEESHRKEGPFVVINCGAIPENLLESELFGYEKGAFTGAYATKKGKLEAADNGTVFLDEIGELPLSLQVKILRFLQEHTIEPVGGRKQIKLNVRIIAATNIDLKEAVKNGAFREDLYYRLNPLTIELPPLRERGEDIILLAKFHLETFAQQLNRKKLQLSDEAINAILTYPWPGNIRELQNKIKRAITLAEGTIITPSELGISTHSSIPLFHILKDNPTLRAAREAVESQIIKNTLEKHNYNIGKTAKALAISRPTLYDLMNKYNIKKK